MTIEKRLYISFALILSIIIFIIGVFFYSTYNLNSIHMVQNDRYNQIRFIEKQIRNDISLNDKKLDDLLIEKINFLQKELDTTENEKDEFILHIKFELIVLLFIAFLLSFYISSKLISEIKIMLHKLNNGVLQLLSNDENTIKIDIDKNNELSEITQNLNLYLEQQDDIIYSREELLRNISHELKTPITKGKFLLEKLKEVMNDDDRKNIMQSINCVFTDIEELTSSLLEREKLNFAVLSISQFKVSTLILESLSKLSIDDESKIDIIIDTDFDLEGDINYLTIALKNLVDNAMKYTKKYPITIKAYNKTLLIENSADKLSNSLLYYIQPFTREPNQQSGHGLGLNIVNKIIKLHNFTFEYTYKNKHNIFYIIFK